MDKLPWLEHIERNFPQRLVVGYADRMLDLWSWIVRLKKGVNLPARIEGWPRGGAKSSNMEDGICWLGTQGEIETVLYVCGTQADAERHLASIVTQCEKIGLVKATGEYGRSKGYNAGMVRFSNGFGIIAKGLDQAIRGIKLDDARPQLIVFDDIDGRHDTAYITQQKLTTITDSILPSADPQWCNYVYIQNPMIRDGVFSQIVDGRADCFADRDMPRIEPALVDFTYQEYQREDGRVGFRVTGGVPTWEGQGIKEVQRFIDIWGLSTFLRESQHEIYGDAENSIWKAHYFARAGFRLPDCFDGFMFTPPEKMVRIVVGVDPNVADTATAVGIPDMCGIVAAGLGVSGKKYVLADKSGQHDPAEWPRVAVDLSASLGGCPIVYESNQGGKLVAMALMQAGGRVPIKGVFASQSKAARMGPVAMEYETGVWHHCGKLLDLEKEQTGFNPHLPGKSPNRVDAIVHAAFGLGLTFEAVATKQAISTKRTYYNPQTGEDEPR